MPTLTTCPTRDQLLAALEGAAGVDAASIEAHLQECVRCEESLRQASPWSSDLRGISAEPETQDPGFLAALDRVLAPAATDSIAPGDRIGEYVFEEPIGAGGMGAVWRARHARLDMAVALKLLSRRLLGDPAAEERFAREMKAVGRLRHPNIVQAFDAGEIDGRHYLAMELVAGSDLARFVKEHGPVAPETACAWVRQAALGLHHAHQAGLVHRDVKPSNLLIADDGTIKLLDLGLARIGADDIVAVGPSESTRDSELTSASRVIGTRDYMAPEQFRDARAVDPRADIYSLGCTLLYLLQGRAPRPGDESAAPPNVVPILRRCLAPDPADRWPTALAFAEALEPATRPRRSRPRWGMYSAIAVAILATAGGGWWLRSALADTDIGEMPSGPAPGKVPMTVVEAKRLQGEWAAHCNRRVTGRTGQGTAMVFIPPGQFGLSTECRASITKPFYISATEITVREFREFAETTGHRTRPEVSGKGGWVMDRSDYHNMQKQSPQYVWRTPGYPDVSDDHPITQVGYDDAVAFCAWLGSRDNATYRLPTEAEWRWACRAGAATDYYWGDDKKKMSDHAWNQLTSMEQPQPVGRLRPNAWGLFDTLGNVEEWCQDWFADLPSGEVVDYRGPATGKARVLAGSAHTHTRIDCQVRNPGYNTGYAFAGFRIVRELDEKP